MITQGFKTNILLIEDNNNLSSLIKNYLENNKKNVSRIKNGKDGLKEAFTNQYDLILLDLGLPDISGLDLLQQLRYAENKTPCIVITNYSKISNEIISYEYGANLFHKKPLNMPLLNAQINRLLSQSFTDRYLQVKEMLIDLEKRIVYINRRDTNLTHTEYNLLLLIIESNGRIISRDEIITNILDYNKNIEYSSVDTMISRLRRKIKLPIIDTVIKTGYRMNLEYLKNIKFLKELV